MKTTSTFVTIALDYDRRLILTAEQAAIVLKATQGAPIYKRKGYDGEWEATDEVLKIEMVRADQLVDESSTS